jgi:DNA (cytosine-5)-methyltransferase 1
MHSYYVNLEEPSSTKLFCGSVDGQLYQALCGNPKRSGLIPLPGDVDFISAGSPCQGFSTLNTMRNNEKGLKNQSLVASVAAYIDFYRPKYGLIENVMTMAQRGLGRNEDVLSQLICAIVGMGYQLQLFVLSAWSLGSPNLEVDFLYPLPLLAARHSSIRSYHIPIRRISNLEDLED